MPVDSAQIGGTDWYRSIDNPTFGNNIQFDWINGAWRVYNTGGNHTAALQVLPTRTDDQGQPDYFRSFCVYPPSSNTMVSKKLFTDQTWTEDKTFLLELPTVATFSGTVIASDTSAGPQGVKIRINGNNTSFTSNIAADGSFEILAAPGTYSVQFYDWRSYTADTSGDSGRGSTYINR